MEYCLNYFAALSNNLHFIESQWETTQSDALKAAYVNKHMYLHKTEPHVLCNLWNYYVEGNAKEQPWAL